MQKPTVPVVINSYWTQPVDTEGDVILVPPGSIKVSGDDEKLYAVRISESGQTATLNGAIVSKGTGALTYGLLFQDDSSLDQDGNIQFYTGKAQIEVVGANIGTGISGDDLTIAGKKGAALSGSLKVLAKSDGASPQASGIYASSVDIQSVLAMNINVGTEAKSEFGYATTYGIFGGDDVRLAGVSSQFRLTAQAQSAMNADSYGISGDTVIDGALDGKILVQAEGLYGDGANAYGFYNAVSAEDVGKNFILDVESGSKTGYANSYGFSGDFSVVGNLAGTVVIKAVTNKDGMNSSAVGFGSFCMVGGVSDSFKLNVLAQGGWSQAWAIGVSGIFSTDGTLSGTFTVKADGCNFAYLYPAYGTIATGFNGAVSAEDISDKFKLNVLAKAKYTSANATGFASTLHVGSPDTLGGTVTVSAQASGEANAEACGVAGTLTTATVSDKFKLTVTATSDTGTASAKGFAATDIVSGLAGTATVVADSKSGNAEAVGGELSTGSTFRTRAANKFEVIAKTRSAAAMATATGITGDSGEIDLGGRLLVTASGANSFADGVYSANSLTGSISGVVSVIGGNACGVMGGFSSTLTVSGGIYAGNKGNAADIAKYLESRIGTGAKVSGKTAYSDQAVELGETSTLTLTDGSIVIGDVTLGGDSALNLSTGSQLYGDIDMSASGTLNITIDGTLNKGTAVVTLDSAGAGVFAPASGVDLTITATGLSETGKYVLLAGSDLSELDDVDFNTLFDLVDFDIHGLAASWVLDTDSKTNTLTMILSDAPVGFSANLLSATDLNSADRMLASSSLFDESATSGTSGLKNALIA